MHAWPVPQEWGRNILGSITGIGRDARVEYSTRKIRANTTTPIPVVCMYVYMHVFDNWVNSVFVLQ